LRVIRKTKRKKKKKKQSQTGGHRIITTKGTVLPRGFQTERKGGNSWEKRGRCWAKEEMLPTKTIRKEKTREKTLWWPVKKTEI